MPATAGRSRRHRLSAEPVQQNVSDPSQWAAELIPTARTLDADRACALGLLAEVLPVNGFREAALAWSRRFTRVESPALFAAVRTLRRGRRTDPEALRFEREQFTELVATSGALRAWTPPG
ncbi:enoyl-CoA hydratase/isomerase family protein [Nocardia noduli]|uniref:enoyl-CoA hydratase/isomerase family protein n=1 Tax=Nocardia noduli TaxID=2815722 RepID=UPI001C22B894|nr:hypothetical protein [Nocardia noduli]